MACELLNCATPQDRCLMMLMERVGALEDKVTSLEGDKQLILEELSGYRALRC